MGLNPLNPEWPKQTTDLIDKVVQKVRSTFTTKAVTATNAVVFGLVAFAALFAAAIVGVIVSIRIVQAYLTWDLGTTAKWIVGVVALVGVLIALVGVVRSSKSAIGFGAFIVLVAGARWALDFRRDEGPAMDHASSVWLSYLLVGGLFMLAGAFLMAKRLSPDES